VLALQDRTLVCEDCGSTFVFTAREQEFYNERGFSDPKRCASCRAARKARRADSGRTSDGHAGGRVSFGNGERQGYRDRPARQMYDIICADCGQPAQVPFKPREDRPVYCRDCYEKHRYR